MLNIYMVTKQLKLYVLYRNGRQYSFALKMIEDICHIKLNLAGRWPQDYLGIIMLLLTPLITYKLYPPELKRVDNKDR